MIRPQDPIWQEGFESLSTAELIALLIKGSSPHWQAELLGAQLMAKVGQNLAALERSSLAELTAIKGIGRSRALSLLYRIVPASHAELFEEQLTHCKVVMYDKCGHYPQIERKADLLTDWTSFVQSSSNA